jgi:hypothetical protein
MFVCVGFFKINKKNAICRMRRLVTIGGEKKMSALPVERQFWNYVSVYANDENLWVSVNGREIANVKWDHSGVFGVAGDTSLAFSAFFNLASTFHA